MEDSTTLIITTNEAGITPSWQAFNPPAEGRTAPQKIYRIHHQIVEIAGTGLVLRLHSEAEQIMLLGLNLIPFIEPADEADEAFLEAVGTLGAYGGHLALDQILKEGAGLTNCKPSRIILIYV
ncbi:MAG: hypothetical protein IIA60_05940 [Candidatus Marinimicrobia bacterium]|nr:hypothetical protein [Candidatus Neomarinimicrobiota bacterium]